VVRAAMRGPGRTEIVSFTQPRLDEEKIMSSEHVNVRWLRLAKLAFGFASAALVVAFVASPGSADRASKNAEATRRLPVQSGLERAATLPIRVTRR
jgi:hypothetical protein